MCDFELIRQLIALMPPNISQLRHQLVSAEVISEPVMCLLHQIEDYVIKEVIEVFSVPNVSSDSCGVTGDHLCDICLKCEAILDKMWEIINCLEWGKVVLDYRYCFGYVSLLKALLKMRSIVKTNDLNVIFNEKKSALRALDLGLLMSPKLTDTNILAKFAKTIHKSLMDTKTPDLKMNVEIRRDLYKRKSCESGSVVDSDNDSKIRKIEENIYLREDLKTDHNFESLIPYYKRRSENKIRRVEDLDLEDFRDKYLITKTPIIITDCMDDWPALTYRKWSVDYIDRIAAFRTVPIEIGSKYTDEEWSQKLMTIREFINQFILSETDGPTGYLAQHNLFDQIEELMADISIPDLCSVTTDYESEALDIDINSWFGPKATVSPLHYDPKDNLLAQVFGQKYVRLYSDETPPDAIYPNDCRLLFNTSQVDVENVDSVKFPNFQRIDNYYECVLKEGEMLFIPKNYWHFVKSLSTSFSISFWWK